MNQRALGISTVLLSLWLLVLPPVSAASGDGNSSDAGVPPTIPGLAPGKANAPVAVSVILPEIVVSGWRRALHNQRALYLKRLLLFEPRVILSSVPYQLG